MEEKTICLEPVLRKNVNYVNYQAEVYTKQLNSSTKQNSFSFIKKVIITNKSAEDIFNVVLQISFSIPSFKCQDIYISCLEANKIAEADSFNVSLDPEYLYTLSEAMPLEITFTLKDESGNILSTTSSNIKAEPISSSAYEDRIPEILCSYVTPNDEEVIRIISKANKILDEKYSETSFAGYQYNDPNKILIQLDAIYLALSQEGISYINPPSSFEKEFQRIRLPREVLLSKMGTCIDLSLLMASLIEGVGLKPIICLFNGHAIVGCFLEDTSLVSPLEDNLGEISRLTAKGYDKLLLIDADGFTISSSLNFEQAREVGLKDLSSLPFLYALDVSNAREEGIEPINTPKTINGKSSVDCSLSPNIKYTLSSIDTSSRGVIDSSKGKQKDKFDYWEEKLLDLNLRNRLINLKVSKSTIQVMNTDSDVFMDKICSTEKLLLQPFDIKDPSSPTSSIIDFSSSVYDLKFKSLLQEGNINVSSLNVRDTEFNIKSLARKGKNAIEESGSNIIFLTVGLIRWYPNQRAALSKTGSMVSPIFLIPIRIPTRKLGQFYISEIDNDSISLNTTAFEYFKQFFNMDFSRLDGPLPLKEDGSINLRIVLNTIREIISSEKSWEVIDEASFISTFSFAHYVMWSDIRNKRKELMSNKIVSSLVEGRKNYLDGASKVETNMLDNSLLPSSLAIPLDADSSQIKAILDSVNGESFILDGPPGTGKSQTIANMIVNGLYSGKKILFVAEKEVALQVVKDRLDKLGLGVFCLQIHSNKASKSSVLDQLDKALEIGHTKKPDDFSSLSNQINDKRKELNSIVSSLHFNKSYFVSLYVAILNYLDNKSFKGDIEITDELATNMTKESYNQILESLDKISILGKEIKGYNANPLLPFTSSYYDIQKRDEEFNKVDDLIVKLSDLSCSYKAVLDKYFKGVSSTFNNLVKLNDSLNLLRLDPSIFYKNLDSREVNLKKNEIALYFDQAYEKQEIKDYLKDIIKEDALVLDSSSLYKEWMEKDKANFIVKAFSHNRILKSLNSYSKYKKAVDKNNAVKVLNSLIRLKTLNTCLENTNSFVSFYSSDVDVSNKTRCLEAKNKFKNTLSLIYFSSKFDSEDPSIILTDIKSSFESNNDRLFKKDIQDFLDDYKAAYDMLLMMNQSYKFDLSKYADSDNYLDKSVVELKKARKMKESLSIWIDLLNNLDYIRSKGLSSLVERYKNGSVKEEDLTSCFKCNLFYKIAVLGLTKEGLTSLDSSSIDKDILNYKKQIDEFKDLTIKEVAYNITSSYPNPNINYASSSPFYMLNKLIKNHGRSNSLRKIFSDFRNEILTICPCLLMSPLSVAQYLQLNKDSSFDLVVFDEASQIPTSEAIGAIARGKNVVIAGDQQQMPPSDFFTASLNNDEDEEAYKYEDMESLLDDAIALDIPRESLMWHYRSHHESLIAFSNNKFYDNKLLTFPSPSNQISQVKYCYINGNYERGKGINKEEADAVVKEVFRRLNDPILCKKSIGIVTFNIHQQDLIDDMIQKEALNHPTLNYTPNNEEIFIKNLENVQGDERDVILFSTCYGKDKKTSTISLNFGPLSREKGERRLNVAVSRAREEMVVFTSLRLSDIAYQRAKNEGASYLYNFLDYAQNGVRTLTASVINPSKKDALSIADFISRDLIKQGYQIDENVGSSSFKVDIAIKSSKDPSIYALGILVDSSSYVDAPTCRDRNIVQPSILHNLKWNLIRVWSCEYLDKPQVVIDKITSAFKQVDGNNPAPSSIKPEVDMNKPNALNDLKDEIKFEKASKEELLGYTNNKPYKEVRYNKQNGLLTNLPIKTLSLVIRAIVDAEAPISKDDLYKRLRFLYDCGRISSQMDRTISSAIILSSVYVNHSYTTTFLWKSQAQEQMIIDYRGINNTRPLNQIPYEELSNAMRDILSLQGQMNKEDLLSTTKKLFNMSLLKGDSKNYLEQAISFALYTKKISKKDENKDMYSI